MLTHAAPYSFAGNTAIGAHRIRRHIEGLIGADGKRLVLTKPPVLVTVGKLRWYYADTDHGERWARFEGGKISVRKEKPTC